MEVDVGVRSDAANFRKRLNGAEFVVGVHDGDEDGVWAYGIAQIGELDEAIALHGKVGDGDTLFFKSLARVEDCFVFDGGGDNVLGTGRGGVDHAEDCVII